MSLPFDLASQAGGDSRSSPAGTSLWAYVGSAPSPLLEFGSLCFPSENLFPSEKNEGRKCLQTWHLAERGMLDGPEFVVSSGWVPYLHHLLVYGLRPVFLQP